MRKLLLMMVVFAGLLCRKQGAPVNVQSQMDDYHVEFLFEHSGAKIYRFSDNGRSHYFMIGGGKLVEDINQTNCGKNCWHDYSDNVLK